MLRKICKRCRLARIFLLAITVGSLQYILERGHEDDWFESKVITTLTLTSFFGFIFFIWRELT
jgi:DHA2 family multidrug resistance protein